MERLYDRISGRFPVTWRETTLAPFWRTRLGFWRGGPNWGCQVTLSGRDSIALWGLITRWPPVGSDDCNQDTRRRPGRSDYAGHVPARPGHFDRLGPPHFPLSLFDFSIRCFFVRRLRPDAQHTHTHTNKQTNKQERKPQKKRRKTRIRLEIGHLLNSAPAISVSLTACRHVTRSETRRKSGSGGPSFDVAYWRIIVSFFFIFWLTVFKVEIAWFYLGLMALYRALRVHYGVCYLAELFFLFKWVLVSLM